MRPSSFLLTLGLGMTLLGGCAGSPTQPMQGIDAGPQRSGRSASGTLCPANPAGTGILPDGDFSKAYDVTSKDYTLEQSFAPGWKVSQGSIAFHGTTGWGSNGFDSYCSVDLDGSSPGGITTAPFATQKGMLYYVTFILSGNGAHPPAIKLFQIVAGNRPQLLGWDIDHHHSAQANRYETVTWLLVGTGAKTTIAFQSLDPSASTAGAVIANVSVSATPPQ